MPSLENSIVSNQAILNVGVGEQFTTINAAILAADRMGGNADIRVNAGTYVNDGGYLWDGVNNVTIEGVGGVAVIVDPSFNAGGKAAIVTGGQNIVLRNLDISGVSVPDGNGAAVRYDAGTLLLDHVHFHGNQNGFLGAPDLTGSVTIQNSEFDGNGTDAGTTHNIYVGDVANFTLLNSYIHDAHVGHEVKSRAENNTIIGNFILDNDSSSSYSIDLPNGGNATITGNFIEQGPNNGNHTINAYGEEGNRHAGTSLIFSDNVVVNDDRNGAGPVWNSSVAVTGHGNAVWNATNLGSASNPSSFTTLAVRPTPDLAALFAGWVAAPSTTPTPTPAVVPTPSPTPITGTGTDPSSSPSPPAVAVVPGSPTATFRFFDMVHGTQFLTTSETERDSLLANPSSFAFEGHGMNAVTLDPTDDNILPVYRFFNTTDGTHFYTANQNERDQVASTRPDLVEERANFAEHLAPLEGDTAVYRFFDTHSGDHFFTQSATENASIVANRPDLVSEGIAFYAPSQT